MRTSRRDFLGIVAAAGLAAAAAAPAVAQAPTEIELFFPVPVDGQLARDMTTLIKEFSDSHPGIKATAVFTGSYDETLIKTRAAMKAGKPPAAVIMSANFILDLKIENELTNLDALIKADGTQQRQVHGPVLPGPARQRGDRPLGLRACRSTIRRRCSTSTPTTSRRPASIPTSCRRPGTS